MKKCPDCGSISIDERRTCGVCGTSLDGLEQLSLEQAESIRSPEFHLARPSRKVAITVVLLGPGTTVLGIFGIFLVGPLGIMLLIFGLAITVIGVTSQGRPGRGWRGRPGIGVYKGISDDQQRIEESIQNEDE